MGGERKPFKPRDISFIMVNKIPELLLAGFKSSTKATPELMKKVAAAELKIGVFAGTKMVGFATARKSQYTDQKTSETSPCLRVSGFYVRPRYQKNRLATRLLRRIGWEARKAGFQIVHIDDMLVGMTRTVLREKRRLEARKIGKTVASALKRINILHMKGKKSSWTEAVIRMPKRHRK